MSRFSVKTVLQSFNVLFSFNLIDTLGYAKSVDDTHEI